ncbi:GMC oxidoreductase [Sporormia fimetaria CBS 119925]|uniref:GMC oxidoreductase n=1 Tax=Sporormia fimetaria CBS 119925 TaxID=1340428 RepID=A0A6A6VMX2_9PLEO|nr:GMC oxidoreductase [Sporormia fimetaria CBS 119925]
MGVLTRLLSLLVTTSLLAVAASIVDQYDYIVVGSGPGGGTVAANLARANYSVLLIEAGDLSNADGPNPQPETITWDFFVKHYDEEEKNRMSNNLVWRTPTGEFWLPGGNATPPAGSEILGSYYPRGATVGGSSMINAMATWLPPDSDWDYIANITGDTSWSAPEMRKVFTQIERNHYLPPNTTGHGFSGFFETNMAGPSSVDNPVLGITQAIASNFSLSDAPSDIVGYMNADPNFLSPTRDTTEGIWGLPQHTKTDFSRFSSRDYINATIAAGYPLTLLTNTLATKVHFTPNKTCSGLPRATAVEYLTGRSLYRADPRSHNTTNTTLPRPSLIHAKNEIILSGGTFNTPQLLLLSGIGPATHLHNLSIPLVFDSPGVGSNLQDNQEFPIVGHITSHNLTFPSPQTIAMLTTPFSPDGDRDILMFAIPGGAFRGYVPSTQSNPLRASRDPPGTYGMSLVKNRPQNRKGSVRLKTRDPRDTPDINFRFYAEGAETDLEALKWTVAWGRTVHRAAADYGVDITTVEPPCSRTPDLQGGCGKEDEEWILGQTFGHHPTSTAAIGPEGDEEAVLDSRFRVRGVRGLRVVDASVFPRIPGVFPVVSTFMVGAKGAGVLLEDAGKGGVCMGE